jgi:hypothetical protein
MELSTTREIPGYLDTRLFPSILWNPKFQYRIHKSSPPVPILSQSTSPHPTSTRSTHLRLGLPSGLLPSCFPTKNLYAFLFRPHYCCMPHPSRPPRPNYSNSTWRRVEIAKLLIMQFAPFACCHLISLRRKNTPDALGAVSASVIILNCNGFMPSIPRANSLSLPLSRALVLGPKAETAP